MSQFFCVFWRLLFAFALCSQLACSSAQTAVNSVKAVVSPQQPETVEPTPVHLAQATPQQTATTQPESTTPDEDWGFENPPPETPTSSPGERPSPPRRSPWHSDSSNLPLQLPGPVVSTKSQPLPSFKTTNQMRAYAERAIRERRFEDAVKALRAEAAVYRGKKLTDAAIILENRAARYTTDVRLFIERQLTNQEIRKGQTPARLEPLAGMYIGAFIDRDDRLPRTFMDENWQTHRFPADFAQMTQKSHASYYMYLSYGRPVPFRWLNEIKKAGAIPHIAWEPKNLSQVKDDAYLRSFARGLNSLGWPVFVRFASEMNGHWTPWHGNPKLYREKFRLVHRVLHKEAPRVATIWCVNNPPLDNIMQYYPGDDGCDWVGVNLYSVPFYENNPKRPAFADTPLALLDPFYKMFAARKPIAICEYAASHQAGLDKISRPEFAAEKMAQLYGALPRLYPRVKLIDWFNMNTIRRPTAGKTLSNYAISENQRVLESYRRVIQEPYFLPSWLRLSDPLPPVPKPVRTGENLRGVVRLSAWAKTYTSRPKLYLKMGDKVVWAHYGHVAPIIELDANTLPTGRQQISLLVFDEQNNFVKSVSANVNIS